MPTVPHRSHSFPALIEVLHIFFKSLTVSQATPCTFSHHSSYGSPNRSFTSSHTSPHTFSQPTMVLVAGTVLHIPLTQYLFSSHLFTHFLTHFSYSSSHTSSHSLTYFPIVYHSASEFPTFLSLFPLSHTSLHTTHNSTHLPLLFLLGSSTAPHMHQPPPPPHILSALPMTWKSCWLCPYLAGSCLLLRSLLEATSSTKLSHLRRLAHLWSLSTIFSFTESVPIRSQFTAVYFSFSASMSTVYPTPHLH